MSLNDASRIVIDDSRVMLQMVASVTDNSRVVIYDHIMFIVHATELSVLFKNFSCNTHECV
jgi:hypothetical protein